MGVFERSWSRIRQKDSLSPWLPLLAVFSVLYGVGVRLRLWAYSQGIFKTKTLPGLVVSIGNLTTGGTGKTPAAIMLARWALNEGYCVAVLSRGYGGRYKSKVLEVSDGKCIKADPRETGDEPYLLAQKLPGIPVVISRKRYLAGLIAHGKFGSDFFILDDGFQHLELKRDLDLVLLDATSPFGNGHVLPWGALREPIDQLARADGYIITRFSSRGGSGDNLPDLLKWKFPATHIFCADHLPDKVAFPYSDEVHGPGFLKGKRILAFAGIARPEVFKETLIELGSEVVYFRGFRDHHQFEKEEIQALIDMKEKLDVQYLLTTEKDWVRMASIAPVCAEMGYLCIKFDFVTNQNDFFKMIKNVFTKKRKVSDNHI